jgi:hypothetical protein
MYETLFTTRTTKNKKGEGEAEGVVREKKKEKLQLPTNIPSLHPPLPPAHKLPRGKTSAYQTSPK